MAYQDLVELTFPEHWPDALAELSMPRAVLALSQDDLRAMASVYPDLRAKMGLHSVQDFSDGFVDGVGTLLSEHADTGAFVKTSYGMLKQNPLAYAPVFSHADLLSNLRFPDRRIGGYLHNRLTSGSPAHLVISPWRRIEPWSEFRLFIRQGSLAGISQYHYTRPYPEIVANHALMRSCIVDFAARIVAGLHMSSVVADVYLEQTAPQKFEARMIELNPFMPGTDPCLYSWDRGGQFDGGFRTSAAL